MTFSGALSHGILEQWFPAALPVSLQAVSLAGPESGGNHIATQANGNFPPLCLGLCLLTEARVTISGEEELCLAGVTLVQQNYRERNYGCSITGSP